MAGIAGGWFRVAAAVALFDPVRTLSPLRERRARIGSFRSQPVDRACPWVREDEWGSCERMLLRWLLRSEGNVCLMRFSGCRLSACREAGVTCSVALSVLECARWVPVPVPVPVPVSVPVSVGLYPSWGRAAVGWPVLGRDYTCVRRACREASVLAGVPVSSAWRPVLGMVPGAVGVAVCGVLRALLAAAVPAECCRCACVACARCVRVCEGRKGDGRCGIRRVRVRSRGGRYLVESSLS